MSTTVRRRCPACGERFPVNQPSCPECGANYQAARHQRLSDDVEGGQGASFERRAAGMGVTAGVVMIVVAAVWFYLGWQAGRIYFYPPILGVVGLVAIGNGLTRRPAARRTGRRVRR